MKNETEDIVYRCKDCSKYNLCQYYYRRKEKSQICQYFELPERKTGKWARQTDDYHDYYECENCGIAVGLDDVKNYCPNCGAKMEVDE